MVCNATPEAFAKAAGCVAPCSKQRQVHRRMDGLPSSEISCINLGSLVWLYHDLLSVTQPWQSRLRVHGNIVRVRHQDQTLQAGTFLLQQTLIHFFW